MFALPPAPHTPYAFRLQGVIDSQADSALSGLDDLIQVKGYDWLEDYMANVERVARAGREGAGGNLAQILKTPSKTPRTAKKTRTGVIKEKQKEARIRLANLDLEASPLKVEEIPIKPILFPAATSSQPKPKPTFVPTPLTSTSISQPRTSTTPTRPPPFQKTKRLSGEDEGNPFLVPGDGLAEVGATTKSMVGSASTSASSSMDTKQVKALAEVEESARDGAESLRSMQIEEPDALPSLTKAGPSIALVLSDRANSRLADKARESVQASERVETDMDGIERGLEDVRLMSPCKVSKGMDVEMDVEAAPVTETASMQVDELKGIEFSSSNKLMDITEDRSDPKSAAPSSLRTEYIVPLKDTLPTKTPSGKSTWNDVQTPVSFSPGSVAFAALPSRGKSIGGAKRSTISAKAGGDVDAGMSTEGRNLVGSSARSVEGGSASAPLVQPVSSVGPGSSRSQQAPVSQSASANKTTTNAANSQPKSGGGAGVRSSWLRQAMANAGGEQGVRKSMAGNVLRKKSEFENGDVEEEEEEVIETERLVEEQKPDGPIVIETKSEKAEEEVLQIRLAKEIKPVERQPLEPILHSKVPNTNTIPLSIALDLPQAAESMPQSKLAKMIADLEEKKAAASASRMTMGAGATSAHNGILSGWNPLRSTLGGLFLREEVGMSKGEPVPEVTKKTDEAGQEEDEAAEADEQEGFSKRTVTVSSREETTEPVQPTANAVMVEVETELAIDAEPAIQPVHEVLVIAEASTTDFEMVEEHPASTTPTDPVFPEPPKTAHGPIVEGSGRKQSHEMYIEPVLRSPVRQGSRSDFTTPIKQNPQIFESTTPMISPPRFIKAAHEAQPIRAPSQLQHISVAPPNARQPKLSMVRANSAEEIQSKQDLGSSRPNPFSALPTRPKTSVEPVQPSIQREPIESASSTTTEKIEGTRSKNASPVPKTVRSGLSISTAMVIPDEESSGEESSDDSEEGEDEEEEDEREEADESKEDIEEAVALLTKDMRLDDEEDHLQSRATSEAPSETEDATDKGKRTANSSLASSKLGASTTSRVTAQKNLMLASSIARKVDGQRPAIGQIDSLMKAQQAREKEANLAASRAAKQEARDQRKRDEMRERAAREKAEQEAERKEKMVRQERLKKLREEQERKRKDAYERGVAEKEKAALAASQKKAKMDRAPKEMKRPPQILPKSKETVPKPAELSKSTAPTRPHPVMKTIIPNGPLVSSSTANSTTGVSAAPTRPLGAPSKPSLANTGPPVRPAKASMQAGLQRPLINHHPGGMRSSTIIPGGGDRKTVTPMPAGGVFAASGQAGNDAGRATLVATKGGEQEIRSEDIELPDIDSDYGLESESEDDAASWAASPALRRAIEAQGAVDPARLFGPMPEFKMDDVFVGARAAKRPRSSSANWSGADRLTEQEKLEYAKRMNYRDDSALVW